MGDGCPVEAILPAGPPCTNDILRRATRHLGHLYDEAFAPTGLKSTQLVLMFQISRLTGDEGPTLQTVAGHVGVGVSALTYALRPLLRDGLVDLVPDLKDKRAKHAVLTTLGRARLDEGIALWTEANRRVEALLGPDDAKLLRTLAERVSSDTFASAFRTGPW
ncbi:MarR family winged helix-turn-helix transcriptional regulator [Methylobacterium sp. M6A4_1b]